MKIIEVDDELYHFIASKTQRIGEDASDILRRLLGFEPLQDEQPAATQAVEVVMETIPGSQPQPQAETVDAQEQPIMASESAPAVKVKSEKADKKADKKAKKKRKSPTRKLSEAELEEQEAVKSLRPSAKLNSLALPGLNEQHGAVGRFLYILDAMQSANAPGFDQILKIKGRDRLYFSDNQEALIEGGSSTKPKEIGSTGFWVITNSNTARKIWMLSEVAKMLGYGESDLRILAQKLLG
jgi:negative modulator of initiation of replication